MVGRASRTRTRSAGLPTRSGTSAVAMSFLEVFQRITSALREARIVSVLAGSFANTYLELASATVALTHRQVSL